MSRGPACQELFNCLLTADLQRFRQADQDPAVGAAAFVLNGGMAGAKQRAEDRLTGVLAAAKATKSKPLGTDDEGIARKLLRRIDEVRKAEKAS